MKEFSTKSPAIGCRSMHSVSRNRFSFWFLSKIFLVLIFVAGTFFGGNFIFAQTPSKVVMSIYQDAKTQMAFNWDVSNGGSQPAGEVQIKQGTFATTATFEAAPIFKTVTAEIKNSTFRKALATGLTANTTYSFRVGSSGNWSNIGTFKTDDGDNEFSFIYTTDIHSGVGDVNKIATVINAASNRLQSESSSSFNTPGFWLMCGDNADSGNDQQMVDYINVMQSKFYGLPYAPVIGNHDNISVFNKYFNTERPTSYTQGSQYSFVYGNVLFLALNSEESSANYTAIGNWIDQECAKYPNIRWKIAYIHRNVYSGGLHMTENAQLNAILKQKIDANEIDLVLQGHEHIYQVIGSVNTTNDTYVQNSATNQETLSSSSNTNKWKGRYNTGEGTMFMTNGAGANKFGYSISITSSHNLWSLFTGRLSNVNVSTYSTVKVTQNEITIATYTVPDNNGNQELFDEIVIWKNSTGNPNLNTLTVSAGSINFDPNTTSYTLNVPNNVTNITLGATPQSNSANVTGTGTKQLNVGSNNFTITVTDGSVTKTYTVTVTRAGEVYELATSIQVGEKYVIVARDGSNNYALTTTASGNNLAGQAVTLTNNNQYVDVSGINTSTLETMIWSFATPSSGTGYNVVNVTSANGTRYLNRTSSTNYLSAATSASSPNSNWTYTAPSGQGAGARLSGNSSQSGTSYDLYYNSTFLASTTTNAVIYLYKMTTSGGGTTPVITITTQPAPTTTVQQGTSTTLNVVASVNPSATLNYQWYYNNQTNSNTGGTPVSTGGTNASFTIPTTLGVNTHYYYCVVSASGATSVTSNVAAVVVTSQGGSGGTTYNLVNTITSGKQYVIVANVNSSNYALTNTASNNNLASGTVTVSNNQVVANSNFNASTMLWTITDIGGGEYSVRSGSSTGNYLYRNSGSPSTLSTVASPSTAANAEWTFDNANHRFYNVGSQGNYYLQYNTGGYIQPTDANGTTNASAIYLYELTTGGGGTTPVITITTQPAPTTNVTQGSISGSLNVVASVNPTATLNYQWYYNNQTNSNTGGTPVSTGGTNASFTIPTTLGVNTHYYYCVVSASGATSVTSNVAAVVVTSGSGGGTTVTYELATNIQVGEQYVVVVKYTPQNSTTISYYSLSSNASGNYLAGQEVTLSGNQVIIPNTVTDVDPFLWKFSTTSGGTIQSVKNSNFLTSGSNNALSTSTSGSTWTYSDNRLYTGSNYLRYSLSNSYFQTTTTTQGYENLGIYIELYKKVVTSGGGGTTPVITITTQPASTTTVQQGTSTTLNVVASVNPSATLNYQWYYNNQTNSNTGGTPVSTGGTNASFTIPTTLGVNTHYYYCVVSASGATSVTSNVAAVVVTSQGGSGGTTYNLVNTITSGKQYVIVANVSGSNYALTNTASNSNLASGTVTVTNNQVVANSNFNASTMLWTITDIGGGEYSVRSGSSTGNYLYRNSGTPSTLSTVASPTTAANAEWTYDNANNRFYNVGSQGSYYLQHNTSGYFQPTDANGTTNASAIYLYELTTGGGGTTPVITITAQPQSTSVTEGSISGSLSVTASVTENATLSYQWYDNTTNSNTPINGATSSTYALPTTLTEGTYYYYCVVSATGGATPVTSNVATVTVMPFGTPSASDLIVTPALPNTVTYDGNAHSVSVTPRGDLTGFGTIDSIYYIGVNGTNYQSGTAPTNAGTYEVRVNISAGDIYSAATGLPVGILTIAPATPSASNLNTNPVLPNTVIYNGNTHSVSVTPKAGLTGFGTIGTISYTGVNGTTYQSSTAPTNIGEYEVKVNISAGTNYNAATGLSVGILTISNVKIEPTLLDLTIDPVLPTTFTYNGHAQGVSVNPLNTLTGFGTIDSIYYIGINGTNYQSGTAPTDVGGYEVKVNILAGANYNATTGLSVGILTITKKELTVADLSYTIPSNPNNVYNGLPQAISITANPTTAPNFDGTITVYYDIVTSLPPTNAGTYSLTVTIAPGNNYAAVVGLSLPDTYTIDTAMPVAADLTTIPALPNTITYDTDAHSVLVTPKGGLIGFGTVESTSYVGINGTNYQSSTAPTNAGEYEVRVNISTGTNYNAATGLSAGVLTIAKKAIIASDLVYTIPTGHIYNGSPQGIGTVTANAATAPNFDGTITVNYNGTAGAPTNAGTYTVTVSITAGTNYETIAPITIGSYTIAKKQLIISDLVYTIPTNHTYNGSQQGIGSVTTSATTAPNFDGTINIWYNGVQEAPTNAGTYFVMVSITAGTNYETGAPLMLGSYTIAKKALTVSDLVYTIPSYHSYNGSPQGIGSVTANTTTAPNFDGTITVIYNGTAGAPTNAGTYSVTVSISAGDNYEAVTSLTLGNYIIAKKEMTAADLVYTIPTNHVYSGSPQGIGSVTANVTSAPNFDGTITVFYNSNTSVPPTNAGTYTLTVNIAPGNNYAAVVGLSLGTYIISPATPAIADLTITPALPATYTYNGNQRSVSVTLKTGLTGFGTIQSTNYVGINGTNYQSTTAPSNAGTYEVRVNISAGTNYTAITGLSVGTLTINKKVLTASDLVYTIPTNRVYNGSPQGISVTASTSTAPNFDGTITVRYNNSTIVPTNAGTYMITVTISAGANYEAVASLTLGNYTIAKKVLTASDLVYAIPTNHIYNGSPQGIGSVTANVANAPNFDGGINIWYNGSTTLPTNAGTYTVMVNISSGTNYDAAGPFSLGNYTIAGKTLTVLDLVYTIPINHSYNGAPQGIGTVTASPVSAPNFDGTIAVRYNGLTVAPTNAGTYTVTVSISAGINYNAVTSLTLGNYTIAKKVLTAADLVYTIPTNHIYNTYPQGIGTVTANATTAPNFDGTITLYYDNVTSLPPTNAGTYSLAVNIAQGNNYAAVIGILLPSTYIISPAIPVTTDLTTAPALPTVFVYNGNPHSISVTPKPGLIGFGTISSMYYIGINGTNYQSTIAPRDSGRYEVRVNISAGINYTAKTDLTAGQFTIGYAMPTITDLITIPALPITFTYDGNPHSVSVVPRGGLVGFGTIDNIYYIGINGTTYQSSTAPRNAGEYDVRVNISAGINYGAVTGLSVGILTITKKMLTASDLVYTIPNNHVYNGSPQSIGSVTVNPLTAPNFDGTITVRYDGSTVVPANAGIYIVTVSISAGTNYDAITSMPLGNYTIAKKVITVSNLIYTIPTNHIYNAAPQGIGSVTVNAVTAPNFDGGINIWYNGTSGVPTNAGIYTITVSISSGVNYDVAGPLSLGSYIIAKKVLTVSDLVYTIPTNHIYNAAPQGIGSVTANVANAPNFDGTITVRYNGMAVAPTNAGTYTVTVSIAAGTNYDAITSITLGNYIIAKKVLTVSDLVYTIPTNHIYNGSPQGIGSVAVNTATAPNFDGTIIVRYNNTAGAPTNAGQYTVTVSISAGQNYDAVGPVTLGNYIIAKKVLTVSDLVYTIPTNHIYSGFPQGIGSVTVNPVTAPNFDGGINIWYNGSPTLPTNAGTYTVMVYISSGQNYDTGTPLSLGNYTIAKKTLTVSDLVYTIPTNHIYNGFSQGIGLVTVNPASAPNFDGTVTVRYNGTAGAPIDAGTYSVTVAVTAGTNYNAVASLTLGNYTIAKKELTATDLIYTIPTNHIYNGSPQGIGSVTVNPTTAPNFDGTITVYYNNASVPPTNAGTYSLTVNITAGNNYAAVVGISLSGSYTIGRATPTTADLITNPALPTVFVYNGTPQGITVSQQNGLIGFGTITTYYTSTDGTTYPQSVIPPTNAGEYKVSVDITAGSNYNAANLVVGTFTIAKKILTALDLIYVIPTNHIYNGSPQGIGSVTVNVVTAPNFDGTITVKYNNVVSAPINANTYMMTVEVTAGYNYAATIITLSEPYIIEKATVIVKADDYTIMQGNGLPVPTVSYSGFLGIDSENNALIVKAIAKLNVPNSDVQGTSVIDFATEAVLNSINGTNYVLVHENGTLLIESLGIKDPDLQASSLKAYVTNGNLHVSGLTAGKVWRVYSVNGALIYQNIATDDTAETNLSVRGIYIIQSENKTVKVVY